MYPKCISEIYFLIFNYILYNIINYIYILWFLLLFEFIDTRTHIQIFRKYFYIILEQIRYNKYFKYLNKTHNNTDNNADNNADTNNKKS